MSVTYKDIGRPIINYTLHQSSLHYFAPPTGKEHKMRFYKLSLVPFHNTAGIKIPAKEHTVMLASQYICT